MQSSDLFIHLPRNLTHSKSADMLSLKMQDETISYIGVVAGESARDINACWSKVSLSGESETWELRYGAFWLVLAVVFSDSSKFSRVSQSEWWHLREYIHYEVNSPEQNTFSRGIFHDIRESHVSSKQKFWRGLSSCGIVTVSEQSNTFGNDALLVFFGWLTRSLWMVINFMSAMFCFLWLLTFTDT